MDNLRINVLDICSSEWTINGTVSKAKYQDKKIDLSVFRNQALVLYYL